MRSGRTAIRDHWACGLAAHETYRGGKGVISIKTGDRNSKVVCIKQVKNVKRGERVVAVNILSATDSPGK